MPPQLACRGPRSTVHTSHRSTAPRSHVLRLRSRKVDQLTGVGRRKAMLGLACFDFDRPPPTSREQQPLTLESTQEEPPLARRKAEARVGNVDDLLRLLQQQL